MMELMCAGTIAARNDLQARAALDDLRPSHRIRQLIWSCAH
jgi:hypothetical protein